MDATLFACVAGTLRHGHPFDPTATKPFTSRQLHIRCWCLHIFSKVIGIDWKSLENAVIIVAAGIPCRAVIPLGAGQIAAGWSFLDSLSAS
jgi:hypothetical protein